MSSQTITIALFAVIAALMASGFLVVWWRDKQNADEVEADPERLDTAVETDVAAIPDSTSSTTVAPAPREFRG